MKTLILTTIVSNILLTLAFSIGDDGGEKLKGKDLVRIQNVPVFEVNDDITNRIEQPAKVISAQNEGGSSGSSFKEKVHAAIDTVHEAAVNAVNKLKEAAKKVADWVFG